LLLIKYVSKLIDFSYPLKTKKNINEMF